MAFVFFLAYCWFLLGNNARIAPSLKTINLLKIKLEIKIKQFLKCP